MEPNDRASPKAWTEPAAPARQYPRPSGRGQPVTGPVRGGHADDRLGRWMGGGRPKVPGVSERVDRAVEANQPVPTATGSSSGADHQPGQSGAGKRSTIGRVPVGKDSPE